MTHNLQGERRQLQIATAGVVDYDPGICETLLNPDPMPNPEMPTTNSGACGALGPLNSRLC